MDASLGIVFGLLAMLGYGLSNAFSQIPAKKIGPKRTIFFRGVFISAILLPVLLFYLPTTNFSFAYIPVAFAVSFIGYLPLITFYKALEKGKVGIVAPIANSSVIFTILLSVIFFGEALTAGRLIAIAMILAGIVLISVNPRDIRKSQLFKMSSGIPFALVTCVLWGMVFFLFKIPVSVLGPILTSFIIEFGITVYNGIELRLTKKTFALPDHGIVKYIFLVALFGAAGTLFYNMGIATSDVSLVAALTFSNPFVASLYGRFAYKEKLTMLQWAAILLIIAGIVAVSYL